MQNNKVALTGYIGEDAKTINRNGKSYVVLNIATRDSFPVRQSDNTSWQERETVWHDVFIFRPNSVKVANGLKKGDKVEVVGSISYKPFKDEKGYEKKQAFIIGNFVDKVDVSRQDSLFTKHVVDELIANLRP